MYGFWSCFGAARLSSPVQRCTVCANMLPQVQEFCVVLHLPRQPRIPIIPDVKDGLVAVVTVIKEL
jgi:hypothetical protein